MTMFKSRRASPDPVDSLLSGVGARELGAGYEAVARLLSGLANAGGDAATSQVQLGIANIPVGLISTMVETVRMNQPRSPLWRRLRFVGASGITKLLIVGGVLVGGTAAAAATGSLPSPIQHSVTRVLSAIGISGSGQSVPQAGRSDRQVTSPRSTLPVTGVRCPSRTVTPAKSTSASGSTTLVKGLPRSCAPGLHHNGTPAKHRSAHGTRPVVTRGHSSGTSTTTTVVGNAGRVHTSGPKNTKAKAGVNPGANVRNPPKDMQARAAVPRTPRRRPKQGKPGKGSGAKSPGAKGKGA